MSDFSASETPADRNLTSIVSVIDDPVRSAMLAALAGVRALPAGELASPIASTTGSING